MPMPRLAAKLPGGAWAALAALLAGNAAALDYRSTIEAATILYDGPSVKAQKISVVGRDYPFEVVVNLDGWVKVRDMAGAPLLWVEKKALGEKRMVVVRTATADVLVAGEPGAKVLFRAEQNVLLELLEPPVSGFARVRHRDGQVGYVGIQHLWGL
jgi:SH3-like domain-containing protein